MKFDLDRQETGCSDLAVRGTLQVGLSDGWPASADLEGTLTVQNLTGRVLLGGSLRAFGRAQCGRCLEDFDLRWDVPVQVMILRDVDSDEEDGETLLIRQRTGEVDLREALRECVVLSFPQAALCKPDCRGLCPECGVNRNLDTCDCRENETDPRWEGLP